jgi:hypothetical protein
MARDARRRHRRRAIAKALQIGQRAVVGPVSSASSMLIMVGTMKVCVTRSARMSAMKRAGSKLLEQPDGRAAAQRRHELHARWHG